MAEIRKFGSCEPREVEAIILKGQQLSATILSYGGYEHNFLDQTGKGGVQYGKHAGRCLETQHYPDAVNHENFLTSIVKAGDVCTHTTIYKFTQE